MSSGWNMTATTRAIRRNSIGRTVNRSGSTMWLWPVAISGRSRDDYRQYGSPILAFHPHARASLFVDLLPFVPGLALEPRIRPAGLVRLLALELLTTLPAIQFERTVIERQVDCAARFGVVLTVAKPATRGNRGDVREGSIDGACLDIPKSQRAHPRCVDDERATRGDDQFAMRRRVPSFAHGVADRPGRHMVNAEKP